MSTETEQEVGNTDVTTKKESKKSDKINIRVMNADGSELCFKIRDDAKMGKLMDAYCRNRGVMLNSLRFTFDGHRIDPNSTSKQLDISDGDVIDVLFEQTGGNYVLFNSCKF